MRVECFLGEVQGICLNCDFSVMGLIYVSFNYAYHINQTNHSSDNIFEQMHFSS